MKTVLGSIGLFVLLVLLCGICSASFIDIEVNEVDAHIMHNGLTYSTVNSAGTGTSAINSTYLEVGQNYGAPVYFIFRTILQFDTSGLNVTLKDYYVTEIRLFLNLFFDGSTTDFILRATNTSHPWPCTESIKTTDYDRTYFSGDLGSISSNGLSGWFNFSIHESGVNFSNYTRIGLRSERDINQLSPSNSEFLSLYSNESNYEPYLRIYYTEAYPPFEPLGATDDGSSTYGWNVKSVPWNTSVSIYDLRIISTDESENYTWNEAVSNTIISNFTYGYEFGGKAYYRVYNWTGWDGYYLWFYVGGYHLYYGGASDPPTIDYSNWLFVGTNGSNAYNGTKNYPYRDVDYAYDRLRNTHDGIKIYGGYYEEIVMSWSHLVSGNSSHWLIIEPFDGQDVYMSWKTYQNNRGVFSFFDQSYIIVRNITINDTAIHGIFLSWDGVQYDVNNITLDHLTMYNISNSAVFCMGASTYQGWVTIKNCNISDSCNSNAHGDPAFRFCGNETLSLPSVNHFWIHDNIFGPNNVKWSVDVKSGSHHVWIYNNTFITTHDGGWLGNENLIMGFKVKYAGGGLYLDAFSSYIHSIYAYGNTFKGNKTGFMIGAEQGAANDYVANVSFYNNYLNIEYENRCIIVNENVVNNAFRMRDIKIQFNTIVKGYNGIEFEHDSSVYVRFNVSCNIFSNSSNDHIQLDHTGYDLDVYNNNFDGASDLFGVAPINGTPLFINDFSYIFYSGSACRDSGIDCGISVDIAGNLRPLGSDYDIGCYELGGGGFITISNCYPDNNSYLIYDEPFIRFTLSNSAGLTMDYQLFFNGVLVKEGSGVSNGTFYFNWENYTDNGVKNWSLNVSNGYDNNSEWFTYEGFLSGAIPLQLESNSFLLILLIFIFYIIHKIPEKYVGIHWLPAVLSFLVVMWNISILQGFTVTSTDVIFLIISLSIIFYAAYKDLSGWFGD